MRTSAAIVVAAATGALAQSLAAYDTDSSTSTSTPASTSTTSAGVVYVTETVDSCETDVAPETVVTVTNGVTVTYCPRCDRVPTTHTTTVYTTVYQSLCTDHDVWSTTPVTYTITETCDGDQAHWTPGPDHIPQDYTITVKDCQRCATPGPVTITEPCGCHASNGIPVSPSPTAGDSASPPAPATPTSNPAGSENRVPGGSQSPAPGGGNNANNPPYPTATTTSAKCPGPQCPSPSAPPAAPWGNTSNITPYKGEAPSGNVAGFTSCFALLVGAFAFLL